MEPRIHRETARHHQAFEAWYNANRYFQGITKSYQITEKTARNWADRFDWQARADARDREAADKADRDAIKRRAAMLTRCRQAGELMVARGVERLQKGPIETDGAALSAIVRGIEVWRTAEGLPAWLLGILNGNEDDLERTYRELDDRRRAALAGDADPPGGAAPLALVEANGRDG